MPFNSKWEMSVMLRLVQESCVHPLGHSVLMVLSGKVAACECVRMFVCLCFSNVIWHEPKSTETQTHTHRYTRIDYIK